MSEKTKKEIELVEREMGRRHEVHMSDPRLTFRCGNKQITLKRATGGLVKVELVGFTNYQMNYLKFAYIQTEEQFNKVWEFFGGDKELPPKDKENFLLWKDQKTF